jgi:anti-sigma factor ChrR (cupin superfamily)
MTPLPDELQAPLEEFPALAEALFDSLPAIAPPATVRERLLQQISADRTAVLKPSAQRRWKAAGPVGVSKCVLKIDRATQRVTYLLKMEAGASLPAHDHRHAEELYILDGDADLEGRLLQKGDYQSCPAGSRHAVMHTRNGCEALIIAHLAG